MGLNWKSVKSVHVSEACEVYLNSGGPKPKVRGLVIRYKELPLPAKTILRIAYCLANNMPPEKELKFSSSEGSLRFLRSLGFQTERLQAVQPVEKD